MKTSGLFHDYQYSHIGQRTMMSCWKKVFEKQTEMGNYDDWMYDEIRYSLESREGNRTNGLVAVYTPEATDLLINIQPSGTVSVNNVDNLFRKNMMNVKPQYKKNPNPGIFDRDYDSYCSLIGWEEFIKNIGKYINIASEKRDNIYRFDITKRL